MCYTVLFTLSSLVLLFLDSFFQKQNVKKKNLDPCIGVNQILCYQQVSYERSPLLGYSFFVLHHYERGRLCFISQRANICLPGVSHSVRSDAANMCQVFLTITLCCFVSFGRYTVLLIDPFMISAV